MKRSLVILLIVLVPVLLFANVFQAFRYGRLERRIVELEREQLALIEENKKAILAISVLTSPRRVGELARDMLELERPAPDAILQLEHGASAGEAAP
jgi:cell division protein FtsL